MSFAATKFPLVETLSIPAWIDPDPLSGSSNTIALTGFPLLETVSFAEGVSLRSFTLNNYGYEDCPLISIDFSNIAPYSAEGKIEFGVTYCDGLTTVVLPESTYLKFSLTFANTLVKELDFSPIVPNVNMEHVQITLEGNALSAAQVNKVLYDLNSLITTCSGTKTITLLGSSAPESSSGGDDGCAARANLIEKGFSIWTEGTCPTTTTTTVAPTTTTTTA
jgi:hypothetical protein